MIFLILGLILFLGIHSVRVIAPNWVEAQKASFGAEKWKGLYSLVSIAGFVLLIWGYSIARENAAQLYQPVQGARGLSFIVMPIAFILLFASQFRPGYIKRFVQHPMLWGVLSWSLVHLLNNGDGASALLFGGFLVWASIDLVSCYGREGGAVAETKIWPDAAAVVLGIVTTIGFVTELHQWLFGVAVV